jgi:hypothetical protein
MRERDAVRMMLTFKHPFEQRPRCKELGAVRRPVCPVTADKTRFIRFAKAGGNKGERSQMLMSSWGEEERYSDRVQARLEEMGTKVPSLRPGTGTVTKKGLTGT